jgi:hypothetical protein
MFKAIISLSSSFVGVQAQRHIPPKCRLTFNGLHGVTSQKIKLFKTTSVRISNPTNITYVWAMLNKAVYDFIASKWTRKPMRYKKSLSMDFDKLTVCLYTLTLLVFLVLGFSFLAYLPCFEKIK